MAVECDTGACSGLASGAVSSSDRCGTQLRGAPELSNEATDHGQGGAPRFLLQPARRSTRWSKLRRSWHLVVVEESRRAAESCRHGRSKTLAGVLELPGRPTDESAVRRHGIRRVVAVAAGKVPATG